MKTSVERRAQHIREAGAGKFYGPARFDAIYNEAVFQIRDAIAEALREHGIEHRNGHENFYDAQASA